MKISVGIDNISEIKDLVQAGADEFFCGFIPREWWNKFGPEYSPNRRETLAPNISSDKKLKKIIKESHKFSKKIYMTLNAHYYPMMALPLVKKIILKCQKYGIDGIIVADLGLLFKIKEWKININTILSGEFGVRNSYDLKLINKNFVISRVILPRYITFEDIKILISKYPQYEFESFIMFERCTFDGSNCFANHAGSPHMSRRRFCSDLQLSSQKSFFFNKKMSYAFFKKAKKNLWEYNMREISPIIIASRHPINKPIATNCGLCVLPKFKKIGITSIKIPGRGVSAKVKIWAIHLIRKILYNNYNIEKIKKLYIESCSNSYKQICDKQYLCYYT